jgi:radical SAM protein with 4Fe4S-binding SPASM domain
VTRPSLAELAANYRPPAEVRFNAEDFGFIVGFPDGEIVLAAPSAIAVLGPTTSRAELEPHLLPELHVMPGFHLRTPPLVWLELTRKCNLTCPHCYIDAGHARASEMSTERWYSLIDEMAAAGVWAVAFTGGEPTLHPAFVDLVRRARSVGLLVGIATHGMFLSDELLDQLPRDGVIISVSVDDLHVGRRGKDSPMARSLESILRAQQQGFLTNVMTSTHRGNAHLLRNLVEWAETHGVSVRSVPLSLIGRAKRYPELENTTEQVELAGQFWLAECEWEHRYHEAAGLCVGAIFNYGLSLAYMTRRCSSGRYLCYIASDGTMFPCTMCAAENLFPASGSLASQGFADVWRADWPMRLRSWDDFAQACEGCPINGPEHYCSSRCPAMSFARHGSFSDCGASEFEIESTLYRTDLLNRTATGKASNKPLTLPAR